MYRVGLAYRVSSFLAFHHCNSPFNDLIRRPARRLEPRQAGRHLSRGYDIKLVGRPGS